MKINSTASFSSGYTTNYGAAQSEKSKAMTKVVVNLNTANNQAARPDVEFKLVQTVPTKQPGTFLNAKA